MDQRPKDKGEVAPAKPSVSANRDKMTDLGKIFENEMVLRDNSKDKCEVATAKPSVSANVFRDKNNHVIFRDKMTNLVKIFENEMRRDSRKKSLNAIFQVIFFIYDLRKYFFKENIICMYYLKYCSY